MSKIKKLIVSISDFFLEKIFRLFKKQYTPERRKVCLEFIGFCIVGGTSFVVTWVVFNGSFFVFKKFEINESLNVILSNGLAFIISCINAFVWNNYIVFKEEESDSKKRNWFAALMKTYITYGFTGLLLSTFLLWLEVSVLHISPLIAPVINLFITTPINFLLNKFWTFKK